MEIHFGYGEIAEHKAEDINEMFKDKEVKMIWCAKCLRTKG